MIVYCVDRFRCGYEETRSLPSHQISMQTLRARSDRNIQQVHTTDAQYVLCLMFNLSRPKSIASVNMSIPPDLIKCMVTHIIICKLQLSYALKYYML